MTQDSRKIVIIGAGIAGLCAGVYARKRGYQVEVIEQQERPGGLATSWRRGDYTFETCLHWLLGSNPLRPAWARWGEVFDIDKLTFLNSEEFVRLNNEKGETLSAYSNVDRMEAEFLRCAPEDAAEIRRFTLAIRKFSEFVPPGFAEPGPRLWLAMLRLVPRLGLLRYWSSMSCREYGQRFKCPMLRSFFDSGDTAELSAIALVFALAWKNAGDAGYPIGGSQAVIRLIAEKLVSLGGRLRLSAKVESIVVEDDTAVGVRLAGGETIAADWVVSAADGHTTIYQMLGGKYVDKSIDKIYRTLKTFPSYLQVSLGVARDLSGQPGFLTWLLDTPLTLDPCTRLEQVSFRIFHYDPTFAPPGKTAVTCFLPTYNFDYWVRLRTADPPLYRAEKQRVADAVVAILEKKVPDLRTAVEMVDVSTPATVIDYTGNWKGSMEGWLLTPGMRFAPLPNTLPGLRHFVMAGHWVMPGGGFPSGLLTALAAVRFLCRHDRPARALRTVPAHRTAT